MATLRFLVPEGTTNYIQNPSIRYDTTGYTAVGATLTRTLDYARFGVSSLKIVTNGSALYEGAYYRVSSLRNVDEPITVSVYVRGTGRVRIRLIEYPTGGQWYSEYIILRTDRWTRISVTGRSSGSNDVRLYVETAANAAQAVTFYADGFQMERKVYPTTYCDGDQAGCKWNILSHGSISTRDPYTRAGGRWIELAGPGQEEKNLYMTVAGGLGMAPITNNLQSYADAPGSYYQNTKVLARALTFTFHAKHSDFRDTCDPNTLRALHQLRQLLIDIIKPDKTSGGEEFVLEYQNGDTPVYLKVRYEGGLEGEWDIRNKWINSFPVRLLAVSPFWYEDNQEVAALDFQDWTSVNYILSRVGGIWGNMNFGVNNTVEDLEFGSRGEVIACGQFTRANNNASAIDPLIPANYVAYWDGTQWQRFGAGANGIIYDIAVAPNGYVYATGSFTSIDGVAANRIAYWNGSAWNAMGTGLNGTGYHVAVDPNGDIFVGGAFTTAGGSQADYIARWDGSWHSIGAYGGLNDEVDTIAISPDGLTIYAGGSFTDQFSLSGNALMKIASYDIVTGLWSALGDGFNSAVFDIVISPTGTLYACGAFTASGSQTINRIAYWNGATWIALGQGTNGTMHSFDIGANGDLIAVGGFTEAGGVNAFGVALWNGSTWANLDIEIPDISYAVLINQATGDFYLGVGTDAAFSGSTLVTNRGTAEVSPSIYIAGPAILRWIENQTTKKRIFLDLDVLSGEEVIIDFGRASIRSVVRGDLIYSVLAGSDFKAFTLIPGENKIAALMTEDIAAKMYINYVPKHWSGDATQHGDAL